MKTPTLLENISTVYKRMSHAAMRAGRDPEEVKLIAVTKTVGVEQIREAMDAGLRIFGENRVQEAKAKIEELARLSTANFRLPTMEWHLIGHLQRNKAKYAVQLFDLIHSVDSVELAREISKHSEKIGKVQRVLVEVKLSPEETKHGVDRRNLMPVLAEVASMKYLLLRGLMAIPPFSENPEDARRYFKALRELRDAAQDCGIPLPELSMGMSGDFEVAIEEGATMVRVGTAIFGERK
ncbi:MAG: YggS family pyridoxal phosphate-dependent enzyme [Nitrospirae bacterium]|nr:YggS family pyridoxal phosphate-dependent enzyme [Nitrospirota bacterium]MCL5422411.1 YggS family pyridoxal phosphate-dependent enzyme [Nitrospirota bacterium]